VTGAANDSFDFPSPDLVQPAALGEPGDRLFLLHVVHDGLPVLFKLEKTQVAALCDYLEGILEDLPPVDPADVPAHAGPPDPASAITSWPVGSLAVAYEEASDRILLVAEPFGDDGPDDVLGGDVPTARIRMTRPQVAGFIRTGRDLVASGRKPCVLCGLPLGPGRHVCPRMN
jgi:uncharacterized repeat protein (TIGR03847 family)